MAYILYPDIIERHYLMKYLFFDIEGASPKLSTIATFGFVLTDTEFNVIERDDILMNPDSKYDWYVLKHLLSYTKAELSQKPKFNEHFMRIQALIEDNDTLVCGYSISNDLKYLNSECKRYDLPSLDFSFLDVQTLTDRFFESKNQIGIERAFSMLGIEDSILLHRSDEDALATMKVAKAVCEKNASSLTDLSKVFVCTGKNKNYSFTNDNAAQHSINMIHHNIA